MEPHLCDWFGENIWISLVCPGLEVGKDKLRTIQQVLTVLRLQPKRFLLWVRVLCHVKSGLCLLVYSVNPKKSKLFQQVGFTVALGSQLHKIAQGGKTCYRGNACTLGNSLAGGCRAGAAPKSGISFACRNVIQNQWRTKWSLEQICSEPKIKSRNI